MNLSYRDTNINCILECAKAIIGPENYNDEQLGDIKLYFKVLNLTFNNGKFEDIVKILEVFFNDKLSNIFEDKYNNDTLVKMLYLSIIIHILKPKGSNTMELCLELKSELHANACAMFAPIILSYISGDIITVNDLDKCINNSYLEKQTGLFKPIKAKYSLQDQCVFEKQKQIKNKIKIQFKAFLDSLYPENIEKTSFEQLVKYVQSPFYKNSKFIKSMLTIETEVENLMTFWKDDNNQFNATQMKENVEPQSVCPKEIDVNKQTASITLLKRTHQEAYDSDEVSDKKCTDETPTKKILLEHGSSINTSFNVANQHFLSLDNGLLSLDIIISDYRKRLLKKNKQLAEQTQLIEDGRCKCKIHKSRIEELQQKIDELQQKEKVLNGHLSDYESFKEWFSEEVRLSEDAKTMTQGLGIEVDARRKMIDDELFENKKRLVEKESEIIRLRFKLMAKNNKIKEMKRYNKGRDDYRDLLRDKGLDCVTDLPTKHKELELDLEDATGSIIINRMLRTNFDNEMKSESEQLILDLKKSIEEKNKDVEELRLSMQTISDKEREETLKHSDV